MYLISNPTWQEISYIKFKDMEWTWNVSLSVPWCIPLTSKPPHLYGLFQIAIKCY